jgi:hypothetical protein
MNHNSLLIAEYGSSQWPMSIDAADDMPTHSPCNETPMQTRVRSPNDAVIDRSITASAEEAAPIHERRNHSISACDQSETISVPARRARVKPM